MPQPVNKIRSKSIISFNSADLSKVPHLISYPMQVIAIWAEIDSVLAEMLTQFTKSDFAVVVSMLHALRSQEAQLRMIRAAARHVLDQADHNLFISVEKSAKASRNKRNRFAHHLWGVPDDPADSLALLDPKDNLRGLAAIKENLGEWATEVAAAIEQHIISGDPAPYNDMPSDHIDWSKVQLYRETDLKSDVGDAQKAREWYSLLSLVVLPQFPEIKGAARQQLLKELPALHAQST
jgi:hypothetical protein